MQTELFHSHQSDSKVWNVSEINSSIRKSLETKYHHVWVRGEVSNLRAHSSGHYYFQLKDSNSQLKAVLFKGDAGNLISPIEDGSSYLVFGDITVYEPRGDYQIRARHLMKEGLGNLQIEFQKLNKALREEGLFEAENKKALPKLPLKIGLITSPEGAAKQDFISILKRRKWKGEIFFFPSLVQGQLAPGQLINAFKKINESKLHLDLVVLTRGGGSIEDLWSFNDEALVRLVADFPDPVISAIGHQTDFVLTDFAADFRAETPSAAAELISSLFINEVQTLDGLALAFKQSNLTLLEKLTEEIKILALELKVLSPRSKIDHAHQTLDELKERLQISSSHILRNHKELLSFLSKRIEGSNLKNILKKGFSYVKDGDGNVISDAGKLSRKQVVSVFFRDGKQEMKTQ